MIRVVMWNRDYPNPFRKNTESYLQFERATVYSGSGTFVFDEEDLSEVKRRSQNLSWHPVDECRAFEGFFVVSYKTPNTKNGIGIGRFEFFDIISKVDLL